MAMRRCCRLFRDVACLLHAFNRTNYIAQNGMRTEDRTQDPPEPTTYDKDEITISQFADEIYQKAVCGSCRKLLNEVCSSNDQSFSLGGSQPSP